MPEPLTQAEPLRQSAHMLELVIQRAIRVHHETVQFDLPTVGAIADQLRRAAAAIEVYEEEDEDQ
jgi:hypothetical protein